ncbi:MAG: bifunctional folylpolyglutamate synthase/dihydrofolate synthase [Calditerricola sp.]|nr:bifunctional folylpolyglutamate synthase/dihydrofolate synthase [Calditerricola sp.]
MYAIRTVQEAIDWIHSLVPLGIKPGLARMEWLMERLDHPHRYLKFIHIAGTNGKGSTAAMMARVLDEAGYDVGLYISPYVERFEERIQLNGRPIPGEELVELVNRVKPLVDELAETEWGPPTEFEVITTLALLYYERHRPYFVVWETGLGGRLDATNIVYPVVAVITNVGDDHRHLLGPDRLAIAREKAGIIKSGVPVVTAEEDPDVLALFRDVCREKRTTLYEPGTHYRYERLEPTEAGERMHFYGPYRELRDIEVGLKGAHQAQNAATALMALELLRQFYAAQLEEEEPIRRGLATVRWPGRFEVLAERPLVIVDGAHNPQGAQALAATVRERLPGRRVHLVVGFVQDKEHEAFLRQILPLAQTVTATTPAFHKALPAEETAALVRRLVPGKAVNTAPDAAAALQHALAQAKPDDAVLVCGSLYLVAEVRQAVRERKGVGA